MVDDMDDAMDIDETVPDAPIIERSIETILAHAEHNQEPSHQKAIVYDSLELSAQHQSDGVFTEQTLSEAKNDTVGVRNEICQQISDDKDDDLQIVEVAITKTCAQNNDAIVVLDDEEDEDETVNNQIKRKPEVTECEIIDLVPKKKCSGNSKCINYACKSGTNMTRAPIFCLSYYRVKNSENKKREVCQECYNAALLHYDELATALISGECLVDRKFPIRNDLVEIDDSDSEGEIDIDESEYFDEENMVFLETNFDQVLAETLEKFNFDDKVKSSVEYLKTTAETVKGSYDEIDRLAKEVRECLDSVQHNLYDEFKCNYQNLPPIEIMDVCMPQARPPNRSPLTTIEPKNVEVERRSPRKVKPISYAELDDPGSSNSPIVTENLKDGELVIETSEPPPDLPPKGPVVKPQPKIGETFYAVRFVNLGSWIKVRLVSIVRPGSVVNGQVLNHTLYGVTMDNKQKNFSDRLLPGKEIAYASPSSVQLDVGARVIAVFRENTAAADKKLKRDVYYPGVVAEPLSATNKYRYLIFFDDGYAQYVHHNMVHLIFESSKDVWEDMHVDSRPFIKKYLETYPERPMVKLRKDQTVRTEYNGKWWLTTVMNIDCSLVQMFFDSSSRIEWIYRGSTRLNPLFKEEQAATNRLQNKSRTPRKINSTAESEPYVQYTRNEPESSNADTATTVVPVRSVAKKSTSKPVGVSSSSKSTPVSAVPFLPVGQQQTTTTIQTPPPSKVVYFTPRAQTNTKTPYKAHSCSPKCKQYITYDVGKLNGYNPLSKPLLCGWNRVTYKHKGKRTINYKAPCGRFIRNMHELHTYLRLTGSEMTVDLFDFDFWVHCLAEFVLERNSTINKDLSNGLENVPIPVVNYNDSEINVFCNYSTRREPMEGVNLNLDPEFLCGCDCEDDCQDKSKCACWQLTLQGLPYLPKDTSPEFIGYSYRRLPEPVITGIYECNSRCKCKSTCLNRVVQNPLQLKLQVFKTNNRGWGIRCLNDIPQGAFICIYAGSMLTEQMANEGGKNYGDEYLAELDYIEVVEKMKEDYEEEAYEEDEDKDAKSQDGDDDDYEDEEEEEEEDDKEAASFIKSKKKNAYDFDDRDFVPSIVVPSDGDNSTIRTRLRRRHNADESDKNPEEKDAPKEEKDGEKKSKDEEDDTVTISDDEDVVREPSSFNPKSDSNLDDTRPSKHNSVREIFAKDECVYVMDAKVTGNIGRFLNHSCSPNVFVQNVFVDTHDLRFPWVAFFALTYIRAGTELTWNYNYDVGSVPGKVMYCHCSSTECRGRLL